MFQLVAMKNLIFLLLIGLPLIAISQQVQNYEGPFEQGEASYSFKENAMHEKVYHGLFKYSETRDLPARGGDNEILLTGNYKDNKKNLAWGVTIKNESFSETVTGQYLNGKKNGMWTNRLRDEANGMDIKVTQASFYKNTFRGKFSYKYLMYGNSASFEKLNVEGAFDMNGKFDGEWVLDYRRVGETAKSEKMTFQHGVLVTKVVFDSASNKVVENIDNTELVNGFFSNMDRMDSSSVVGDAKWGLKHSYTEHAVLKPVLSIWTKVLGAKLGNHFNSSLPTFIIKTGELEKKQALRNQMVMIDWKETPKGKREYEEQRKIEAEYENKISLGNKHFELKNYQQAIKLYKEATGIKKDETYPQEQITKLETLIADEEKKQKLARMISGRSTLWKGNEKMLEGEEFYGKKKHLYEATVLAFGKQKREILSNHRETRTNLDRKTYDNLKNPDLEAYLKDLDDAIALQDKVKKLAKSDDTKDLEKELKKLESTEAIINRLMQE